MPENPVPWAKVTRTEEIVRARHPAGAFDALPRAEQHRRIGVALLAMNEPDLAAALLAAATDPDGPLILPPDRSLPAEKFAAALTDPDRRPLTCPTHPGTLIRDTLLPAAALTQTDAARRLGVARQSLNNVLSGGVALSADMAARLGHVFGIDPSPLLHLQAARDLWFAERALDPATLSPLA